MNFVPIAIALRPRKLIAALPSARVIFAPSPGLSPPSILTQWMVSVFARPASCAARVAFAPLTGQTNRIPLPGCSGVRRANTSSRSAPALACASSLSAALPARSTSIADQTSAFVTLSAMVFPLTGMHPANLLPCAGLRLASALVGSGSVSGEPVIRECLQSVLTSLLAATNRRKRRQFYEKTVSPPFGHRDQAGEVDLVLQYCRIATGSGDNENNRRGDRLPFRRPACGHKRPSNQRN